MHRSVIVLRGYQGRRLDSTLSIAGIGIWQSRMARMYRLAKTEICTRWIVRLHPSVEKRNQAKPDTDSKGSSTGENTTISRLWSDPIVALVLLFQWRGLVLVGLLGQKEVADDWWVMTAKEEGWRLTGCCAVTSLTSFLQFVCGCRSTLLPQNTFPS